MKTPRIYTEQALAIGINIVLESNPSRHLLNVLRLRVGASLELFNGDGSSYLGTITLTEKNKATALVEKLNMSEALPPFDIHLAIGISKGERMDYAIQKAVELGVTSITPLISERTAVRLAKDRQDKKQRHWQNIITSACEQSYRNRIPTCAPITSFSDWLKDTPLPCLLLDPRSNQTLSDTPPPQTQISLLVGPEGGLSELEVELAQTHGCIGIRLGPRVLRTETAPLAAISAIQMLWGDFK